MVWASWMVIAVAIYALAGVAFAAAFVTLGVGRVDRAAAGSPLGFRLLVAPGVAAMWPLFARRWRRRAPPPEEVNAHRRAAREAA